MLILQVVPSRLTREGTPFRIPMGGTARIFLEDREFLGYKINKNGKKAMLFNPDGISKCGHCSFDSVH